MILRKIKDSMKQFYRKTGKYFAILLFVAISVSCVSTKTIVIEIPQKSKDELPQTIQSLTIVTRTIDDKFNNLDSDSLQRLFYLQQFNYDTIINDIQAVDTTLKALGELLFESGRYDFVIPENRFLAFEKNSFLNLQMPAEEVKQLCETYRTDAVLSLDHFKTKVSTQYQKESFYDSMSDGFSTASYAEMKIYYEALFRVYDPEKGKVILREFLRDTVIWEDMDATAAKLFKHFTPVKTALSEAGIAIALDFAEKISTKWRQEKRIVFNKGDKNLKLAIPFVVSENWEAAAALWKETAEKTKSKSAKSKAEYNIAVYYELQGDLPLAISWALKSYETMYRIETYDYLEVLKRRKNELKKQLQ